MYKKIILSIFLILLNTYCVYAISASSAIVMDAENGRIFYEKNANKKMGIASTTKIMTAIVVLENCNKTDVVKISKKASLTEGSSMYIKENEEYYVEDLLYGLMLNSGNDAATALAEHLCGSTEEFAKLMNKKAVEIGMKNSSFANPHGLDNENHYSTAYDMALLTKYAMNNNDFKNIVATKEKIIEVKNSQDYKYLTNHNKLLKMYDGCTGVKTGFTKKCGRCLVSSAEKNDVKLICITLNAPDDWNDHITLYNNIFDIYKSYNIVNTNDYIASSKIENIDNMKLELYACKAINLTLNEKEYKKIKLDYYIDEHIYAPVYKGQTLGILNIKLENEIIASTPLISNYGINIPDKITLSENFFYVTKNFISIFSSNF